MVCKDLIQSDENVTEEYAGDLGNSELCQQMNKVGVLIYREKSLVLGPNDEDFICIDGQQENASFVRFG